MVVLFRLTILLANKNDKHIQKPFILPKMNPIIEQINKTGQPAVYVFDAFSKMDEIKKYVDVHVVRGDDSHNIKIFFTDTTRDQAYDLSRRMIDEQFAVFVTDQLYLTTAEKRIALKKDRIVLAVV